MLLQDLEKRKSSGLIHKVTLMENQVTLLGTFGGNQVA